jgi:hypothetical protein
LTIDHDGCPFDDNDDDGGGGDDGLVSPCGQELNSGPEPFRSYNKTPVSHYYQL